MNITVQVLEYDERLTCSKWVDLRHKCRTRKGLLTMLRRNIKHGCYHGYRLITIHEEHLGMQNEK